MNTYKLIKPLLFCLQPELAHTVGLQCAELLRRCYLWPCQAPAQVMSQQCLGLDWPNPLGLAAGVDKNGDFLELFASFGFGFIELGTVTPKAQLGQPKPRLFRYPSHGSLINRMGFNNKGVDYLVERVERSDYKGILGINIGKNADTPQAQALADYCHCLSVAYPVAHYITVNISSPNTKGLRDLQHGKALDDLLAGLKTEQAKCQARWHRYVPIWVKVSPDLSEAACQQMAVQLQSHGIDGVVVSNTTVQRPEGSKDVVLNQSGGLSGQCLTHLAQQAMQRWSACVGDDMLLVGVGGIADGMQAKARLDAGAKLLQLYTALVYEGPACVIQILNTLARSVK
jgi:dihydroorotate dehydrogenase